MNKNLQGGYYIVSLGDVDLLGESVSLPNIAKLLYEAKKHKFVILQDIVMGGNAKVAIPVLFDASMAFTTEPDDWDEETDGEFVPEPIYTATIYNVYGKNITIDAEGSAIITDYFEEVDPSDFYGKFVKVINATDIPTPLTLDFIEENFYEGFFINGDIWGLHNPIVVPAAQYNTNRAYGIVIGRGLGADVYTYFKSYILKLDLLETQIGDEFLRMDMTNGSLWLGNVTRIRNKPFPIYPSANANPMALAVSPNNGDFQYLPFVNNVAPEFSDATTYAENDLVIYEGVLYKCSNVAGHTGAWDATDFTRTFLSEVI